MIEDYRNTKYCPVLENLQKKKDDIVTLVKNEHPKAVDMHTYISKNEEHVKNVFIKAYNGKCSYCGASLDILPKSLFQIDHFIFQKALEFNGSKAAAGHIENLVLACNICNHCKSAFSIPKDQREYLHPDKDAIRNTFIRDDNYYIQVSEEQSSNAVVNEFYKKLKLGSEIHRLDYLLMSMIGLQEKLTVEHPAYATLGQAINQLKKKRNIMA